VKQLFKEVPSPRSEKGVIGLSNFRQTAWLALLLGAVTFALFAPAIRYDFVNLDDELYVKNNPMVLHGLTLPGLRWAWCGVHENYWLPVLWLSYMLDSQLFGTGSSGYHFTNVSLHAFNATLLFLMLARTTGRRWLAFFAAAFFAWHPLRVESVAWVTERKDVLSVCFGLLALWAYGCYAEFQVSSSKTPSGARKWHGLALLFFILGLMSKPMLVSLPLLLLLLDVWPLKRVGMTWAEVRQRGWKLVLEKWSWCGVAAVFSGITYYTQSSTGAVLPGEAVPFVERWLMVPLAYWFYLAKTFWPKGLAIMYPALDFSWGGLALVVFFLSALTVAVVKVRRRCAPLPVGWLWFVVTLLPVIGLVRAGFIHVADRFTYLPSVGLGILLAWGLAELASSSRLLRALLVPAAVAMLAGFAATTWFQLQHWRNTTSLWTHAVAVTSDVPISHHNLAKALTRQGKHDEAVVQFAEANRIFSGNASVHYDWGNTLGLQNKLDEAIAQYAEAVKLQQDYPEAQYNWGNALVLQGELEEAKTHFLEALRLKPKSVDAHNHLGNLLVLQGRMEEAVSQYLETLRINPTNAEGHYYLAGALARQKRMGEAVTHFQAAVKNERDYAVAANDLAWILATETNGAVRSVSEAVRWAERACAWTTNREAGYLDTLGVAYAEAGRFKEAIEVTERAVARAMASGDEAMAGRIGSRLEHYRVGKAYRDVSTPAQ